MQSLISKNLDDILAIANRKLINTQSPPLNSTEIMILQGIWQDRTYTQIALEEGYSPGYFTTVVAPQLYRRLSQLIGQRVTKKNCRWLLESYVAVQTAPERQYSAESFPNTNQNRLPCYPSGSVALDSPFYIKRSPIEEEVCEEIGKLGALVRIKTPREMGKTSLLLRILNYVNSQGYRTVSLNLEQVDQTILSNLNQFLRWLCANVARQLQVKPRLDEYWNEDLGSKISCTLYFQDYLLKLINTPLVLAFDEVNKVFEHPQVAKDFLLLLRSWYEEAKRLPIWQKLRLIVVQSTEIDVPLQLNQSPFDVGLPIQLDSFSLDQVQQLAQRYGLKWTDYSQARQLMAMVGGHPALVHTAIYHLSREELTLTQLLETAPTAIGIYAHHLQRHWVTLQKEPELAIALNKVMKATEPVSLEPIVAYKLSSVGLIKQLRDQAIPGCELYRRYFISFLNKNITSDRKIQALYLLKTGQRWFKQDNNQGLQSLLTMKTKTGLPSSISSKA